MRINSILAHSVNQQRSLYIENLKHVTRVRNILDEQYNYHNSVKTEIARRIILTEKGFLFLTIK